MRNVLVVYRILYGTDYLERSIRSVLAGADQVFVGYSKEPWSRPKPFTDIREIEISPREVIDQHFDDKVVAGYYHYDTPRNQFRLLRMEAIRYLEEYYITVFMEPDMVWAPGYFEKFIDEFKHRRESYQSAPQIELWKTNEWRIPQRNRLGATAYKGMIPTLGFGQQPATGDVSVVSQYGHFNFGFCLNEQTMRYKHEAALDFSAKIGDSVPAQHWYEEKWLNWTPETMNLEPSANHTHRIPKALPYDMPTEMREFMDANPIKNA